MATYRIDLSHTTPDLKRFIENLPGVTLRERCVTTPDNAAWLVEKAARLAGVRFSTVLLKADRVPLQDVSELVKHGLREWVPAFLTPYQREGILATAHRDAHLWWAAGSGKTAGAICWSLAYPGATVIVTRAGVRRSHAREIERLTEHRACVIEGAADAAKLEDTDALFCVVGWENLPDVIEHLLAWRPQNVVFDECFPGETLVSTPDGERRIDSMLPGDVVLSVDAQGKVCKRAVTRVIVKRLTVPMVRVTHENGSFVCTANHKVWTEEDGYVEAGRLGVHHHLRVVRVGVGGADPTASGPAALLQPVVQREVANGTASVQGGVVEGREGSGSEGRVGCTLAGAGVPRTESAAHDGIESDGGPRNVGARGDHEAGQAVSRSAWREWARFDEVTGGNLGYVFVAGAGVFGWGSVVDASGEWRSTVLAGLGDAGEEAGDRSGRTFAQDEDGSLAGRAEGRDSGRSRVVAVACDERGCVDTLARNAGAYPVVFDLEVEGTHTYFADGVRVSNCHKAKSNKRWSATPQENGKVKFDALQNIAQAAYRLSRKCVRRLATTATPIKDRTRDLWAQLDLVHPDAWGRFYSADRASFTGRYCAARPGLYGGIETGGSSNLDELWERVSIVIHQVPHSETHRHLPPRRRLVTYVTQAEQCAAVGFTKGFFKTAAKGGQAGILEARLCEAAAKKRKLLLELVAEAVEGKQKVVIFTGRREDCEKLAEDVTKANTGARVFTGHGGTPPSVRDQIQQDYMSAAGPAILVGTGDAWGEGVNLQDTDLMLIAMLPYTPGQIVQWEGRVARHGQKRPVLIQYLVAENTVDEHVAGILLDKLPAVEKVSNDDSLDGFSDALMGADQVEEILSSVMSKLGV